MQLSEQLYEVIKSLSQGENKMVLAALYPKRALLYRIYQRLESHDLESIKAQFPHNSTQLIASTKRQLLEQILEVLWRGYPKNGLRRIHDCLGEAEILTRKGLYEVALARVEEAIGDAVGLEAMQELLKALDKKRQILEIIPLPNPFRDRDNDLHAFAVRGAMELAQMELCHSKAMAVRMKALHERPAAIAEAHSLLSDTGSPVSQRARLKQRRILYILHRIEGRLDACADDCREALSIFERHPDLLLDTELRDEYFSSLHFMIAYQTERFDYITAEKDLKRLELAAKKWFGGVAGDHLIFSRYTFSRLGLLLYQRKYPEVKALLKEILSTLLSPQHKLMLRHKPRWLRLVFQALLALKDYKTVRVLAYEIKKNTPEKHQDHEFYVGVGLSGLFAMLEENDEYLANAIVNTRKWFDEIGCSGEYESLVLDFIKRYSKDSYAGGGLSLLQKLKTDLEVMFQNPYAWQSRETFPIMEWIRSKLEGLELRDILFFDAIKNHPKKP